MSVVTASTCLFLLLFAVIGSSQAAAQAYLPPSGQVFQGVTGQPISDYETAVGKHPAIYQVFSAWGEYLPGMFADAGAAHARLMIAISTDSWSRQLITPQGIADGRGDAWLIALNHQIAASGHPVYIRLMAEMDNYNNSWCAYNVDGSSRGPSHSAREYRLAWKRATLILRGGSRAHIDGVLRRLRLPPLRTHADLPVGQVAMLWVPMTSGDPAIPANQPAAYWPGRAWVDWVGTDFYSKFPNFSGLASFYARYRSEPFVFGEYAMWGADNAAFITQLFGWVHTHARVQMLVYNQGDVAAGPFRLFRYPAATRALRSALASPRFPAFAPDWQ